MRLSNMGFSEHGYFSLLFIDSFNAFFAPVKIESVGAYYKPVEPEP